MDGIRVVSIRGPFAVGSGKSGTPLSRMHWANLRAASCCWALLVLPMNPGGSRSLHALMACWNVAEFGSSDEPFITPSMVSAPDASGSGKLLTPLARMHWANFTACATLAAGLPAPVAAGALEPHALIRATIAIAARAAPGHGVLLMFPPGVW